MTFLAHTIYCWLAVWSCASPELGMPSYRDGNCKQTMQRQTDVLMTVPMGRCVTMRAGTDKRKQENKEGVVWVDAQDPGLCQVLDLRMNGWPYSVSTAQQLHYRELRLAILSVYLHEYCGESSPLSGPYSERNQCSV